MLRFFGNYNNWLPSIGHTILTPYLLYSYTISHILNDFLSPVLPSLRWPISLLKTYCWCNLTTSCCAYSSNDTWRSVGNNALVVQSDVWCLVLEIRLFLYFSIQATTLLILAQSEAKDSNLSMGHFHVTYVTFRRIFLRKNHPKF